MFIQFLVAVIGLESTSYSVTEGNTPVEICASVMSTTMLGRQVVVMFSTQDGTATSGE